VFGFSLLGGNRSSDLELNLCIMELTRSELSQFGSTAHYVESGYFFADFF